MPRLQVRQSIHSGGIFTRGEWHDVASPAWLVGFVLPEPGFSYEFRNAPVGETLHGS